MLRNNSFGTFCRRKEKEKKKRELKIGKAIGLVIYILLLYICYDVLIDSDISDFFVFFFFILQIQLLFAPVSLDPRTQVSEHY